MRAIASGHLHNCFFFPFLFGFISCAKTCMHLFPFFSLYLNYYGVGVTRIMESTGTASALWAGFKTRYFHLFVPVRSFRTTEAGINSEGESRVTHICSGL